MREWVRRHVRSLLGTSGVAALRGVVRHASAAAGIIRGNAPWSSESDFTALDVEELLAGIRRHRRADSEHSRDRLAVRLMQRVATDQRFTGLLQSRLFLGEAAPPLGGLLAGAALFGGGHIEDAYRTLEATVGAHPSIRGFYCLARCASHGLLDHRRSLDAAQAGLHRFPGSHLLTMVAAVAAYRLGDSEQANRLLEGEHPSVVRTLRQSFPGIDSLQGELTRAIASGAESRNTQYSTGMIDTYWHLLFRSMECFNGFQNGWAAMRWLQRTKLESALRDHAQDVKAFINFGAFCAWVDADLAEQFPGIDFQGVDLGARTKALNQMAFQRQNLGFHDEFILDFLQRGEVGKTTTMLFHARTATLFYPKFLQRFYRRCAALGIRYLALWENGSLSYSTARFHDLGRIPDGAVAYRDVMFIHDYRALLELAGYEIVQADRSPSNRVLVEDDALTADGHVFVLARLRS